MKLLQTLAIRRTRRTDKKGAQMNALKDKKGKEELLKILGIRNVKLK